MQAGGGTGAVGEAFHPAGQRVDAAVRVHTADAVAVAAFGHVHQTGRIQRHAEGIIEARPCTYAVGMTADAITGDAVDPRGLGER